jgi:hypothetical protein
MDRRKGIEVQLSATAWFACSFYGDIERNRLMADLSDFVVTAHLRDRGWEAEIRRRDGKEMRVEGTAKLTFTTMMVQSSSEAIELAYQAINVDKVLPVGWV